MVSSWFLRICRKKKHTHTHVTQMQLNCGRLAVCLPRIVRTAEGNLVHFIALALVTSGKLMLGAFPHGIVFFSAKKQHKTKTHRSYADTTKISQWHHENNSQNILTYKQKKTSWHFNNNFLIFRIAIRDTPWDWCDCGLIKGVRCTCVALIRLREPAVNTMRQRSEPWNIENQRWNVEWSLSSVHTISPTAHKPSTLFFVCH